MLLISPERTMIHQSEPDVLASPPAFLLARYGSIPQVARFSAEADFERGSQVVCETDRGIEVAEVLQQVRSMASTGEGDVTGKVLRLASDSDLQQLATQRQQGEAAFADWLSRIVEWQLQLELIDLEQTLDGRLILYVLNERGAETTRLALLAAARGLGIVQVQPVGPEGIISGDTGGGCGSCGCGH
ncbi:MAG: hypothetical protein KDA85_07820 [Planctomycetaceae bacterium]|nr:hypothetical protein [Planctomycetaceae bacterium]